MQRISSNAYVILINAQRLWIRSSLTYIRDNMILADLLDVRLICREQLHPGR